MKVQNAYQNLRQDQSCYLVDQEELTVLANVMVQNHYSVHHRTPNRTQPQTTTNTTSTTDTTYLTNKPH